MSRDAVDKAKSRWDNAYEGDHADQAHVCNTYALASMLYWQLYGNRCFGNTGDEYGWLSWLKRAYGASRIAGAMERGSGNSDVLLDLRRLAVDHYARRAGLVPPINLVLARRPKDQGRDGRSKTGG
jgi:hypothetical protein